MNWYRKILRSAHKWTAFKRKQAVTEVMPQALPCPGCNSENIVGQRFCSFCGQRLVYFCPYCQVSVDPSMTECPDCNKTLPWPTGRSQTSEEPPRNPDEVLEELRLISTAKKSLPSHQQRLCNSLGLNVRGRDFTTSVHGFTGVEIIADDRAGTKAEALYRDGHWEIEKYEHGNWEALVKPTAQLAAWLTNHTSQTKEDEEAFNRAIEKFRKQVKLDLP